MKRSLVIVLLLTVFVCLKAQQSNIYSSTYSNYNNAVDLFDRGKYNSALTLFREIIKDEDNNQEIIINAKFYSAICAIKLYHNNAEYEVYNLLKQYPDNEKANTAAFELGRFQYQRQHFHKAVKWFEKTDKYKLPPEDLPEYYFKLGYSYFIVQKRDTARVFFYEIKDMDTKYTSPAIYYYSHINYIQKNYQTALEGFLRLTEDETFGSLVPYYISHIYYLQEKYTKVLDYAPPLLETVTAKRRGEMKSIIGDSYFKLKQYKECIPYFEDYIYEEKYIAREMRYQLGFAYYKIEQYDSAISKFMKILDRDDDLTQNTLYHLGLSYLSLGMKKKAMTSFLFASNLDFSDDIKREALFNYGKLAYELSYNPFNEAIKAFNKYIELYPYSPYIKEVYGYMIQVYLSTRNYSRALEFLEKIEFKDDDIKTAYQRAAFYRGLEFYNDQNLESADEMLDKSLKYRTSDMLIQARTYYWKGEIAYKENNYEKAIDYYNKFLSLPATINAEEYNICHYNNGYAYFKLKNYTNAAFWFNKFIAIAKSTNQHSTADAYNRLGDIAFLETDYSKAIEAYENSIEINAFAVDYSIFQKGFCQGLIRQYDTKIKTMEYLIESSPHSDLVDDAIYEIGRTYGVLNMPGKAEKSYNKIINDFPNSSYQPKALVQLGLINYNADKNDIALEYYKKVVEHYSSTKEAKNALLGIKNIYIEKGNVDPYYAYIANLNVPNISESIESQDSATYNAAVNTYMAGNCEKAVKSFNNYLDKFENGGYRLNAYFYIAECYYKNKEYEKALESFNYIIDQPQNIFTVQALTGAALVNYAKKDYSDALKDYKLLGKRADLPATIREANLGEMRCNFNLNDYQNSIISAENLLAKETRSEEIDREAYYVLATSYFNLEDYKNALKNYEKISDNTNSKEGAEAKYKIAKIYFIDKEFNKSQDEILNFAQQNTSHEYWLAKSFILLSDIFVEKEDIFQATATLNSIINNYATTTDGIIDEAKSKLEAISPEVVEPEQVKDDLEIEISN